MIFASTDNLTMPAISLGTSAILQCRTPTNHSINSVPIHKHSGSLVVYAATLIKLTGPNLRHGNAVAFLDIEAFTQLRIFDLWLYKQAKFNLENVKRQLEYNMLNYSWSEIGQTNLIVYRDITSCIRTSFDNTLMLSPRQNGWSFQPLVTQVRRSSHGGSIPVFQSQLTSLSVRRGVETVQGILIPKLG